MKRLLPVARAVLAAAWILYLWWGHWGDASAVVRWTSAVAVGSALAAALVPADRPRAHAALAALLMLVLAGFATARVVGRWPFAWDAMPDPRYAAFIAGIGLATAIGILRGAFWARWAAIAVCAGSVLGGVLNSLHLWRYRDESTWLAAIAVIGGGLVLTELLRPQVRAHFARHGHHALWSSGDPLVRLASWAAIANFAAAPMLLLYALGQPVAPRTVVSALIIAPILGLGGVLVVLRRAAGVVVLGLGGLALVGQTVASAQYVTAGNLPVVGYYAAFWLPAALLGLSAAALALHRARR